MKGFIHQLMENQLKVINEENQVENNSFVYFEKSTLNLLLLYLLSNESHEASDGLEKEALTNICEELERILVANEKEFEEVIHLLKENL